MKTAAKAFYDYCHDKEVLAGLYVAPGFHLKSIVANVVEITRKLSAEEHTKRMLNQKHEYRWCFFDFMLNYIIRVKQEKKCYTSILEAWPGFKKLEDLPALGWAAYEHLVNDSYSRGSLLGLTQSLPGYVGHKVIFGDNGPTDMVYWQSIEGSYDHYMERIPLGAPKVVPTTLGEELQVLADWLKKAGKAIKTCCARDYFTFFSGPKSLVTKKKPETAYKSAKVRPASHDDAVVGAQRKMVQEQSRVEGLMSDFFSRLCPADRALFKKYPEKAQKLFTAAT